MRLTSQTLSRLSRFVLYTDREGWETPDIAKQIVIHCDGRIYKKEVYKRLEGKDSMPVILSCLTIKGKRAYAQLRKILEVLGSQILTKPRITRGGILFRTMFDPTLTQVDIVLGGK